MKIFIHLLLGTVFVISVYGFSKWIHPVPPKKENIMFVYVSPEGPVNQEFTDRLIKYIESLKGVGWDRIVILNGSGNGIRSFGIKNTADTPEDVRINTELIQAYMEQWNNVYLPDRIHPIACVDTNGNECK